MADIKLTTNKLRKMRAVFCGELLVDFVMSSDPGKARKDFVKRFKTQFGYRVMGPNSNLSEKALENIGTHQFYIRELLDDFLAGDDLSQSLILAMYVDKYNLLMQKHSLIDVYHFDPKSAINVKKSGIFDGSHFTRLSDAIAYCVIMFLASELSERLFRCEICGKIGLSASKARRFCSKTCGNKSTRSKEDPDQKRKYRKERRINGLE